jgi:glycosyltransferase involved in cell wall biosynthesis
MHIAFVARRYWPAIGGMETFVRHLALDLGRRHEVTVLAHRIDNGPTTRLTDSLRPPPSFEAFEDGPVRVQPLRISVARRTVLAPLYAQVVPGLRRFAYGRLRMGAAALYARAVAPVVADQIRSADALHMWGGDLLAAAAVRAARLRRIPVMVTPFAHRGAWGDDIASAATYRRANRVISLLQTDANVYRDLGIQEDRLATCGVCSPAMAAGGGHAIRRRYGIKGPLVLFLGVRRPYKGFDLLLEAARRVAIQDSQITFAFVGPGPRLPADTDARTVDVGQVDDLKRAAWLDASDLLCLPSDGEIFPVSILEAWSLRKPVVTSDIPCLREVVGSAHGGVVVPRNPQLLAQAILDLLADPNKLHAMGAAGHAWWAAHNTVKAVADWHEYLYMSLVRPRVAEETVACAP